MVFHTLFGIAGLVIISVAIWFKNERRQDFWFIIGGAFLLVYSVGIGSVIFVVLQIVFIISAFLELLRLKKGNGDQIKKKTNRRSAAKTSSL